MISSLRGYLNNTVDVLKFVRKDGAGDSTYAKKIVSEEPVVYADDTVETACYIVSKITTVVNAEGKEVTSNIQIYLDGESQFTRDITDNDIFILGTKKYGVKAIADYYAKGLLSLRVVYV